jgi:hypothetical protein
MININIFVKRLYFITNISYLRIIYRIISENLITNTFLDWYLIAIVEHDSEITNEDPR